MQKTLVSLVGPSGNIDIGQDILNSTLISPPNIPQYIIELMYKLRRIQVCNILIYDTTMLPSS